MSFLWVGWPPVKTVTIVSKITVCDVLNQICRVTSSTTSKHSEMQSDQHLEIKMLVSK